MNRREFLHCLCSAGACSIFPERAASWHEFARPMMGSVVSLALYGERKSCEALSRRCFAAMNRAVSEITDWEHESAVSRLNRQRSLDRSSFSPLLPELISQARESQKITKGLFSPVMRRLSVTWREARDAGSVPDSLFCAIESRTAAATGIGTSAAGITLSGQGAIDFGGIGKGFIADYAAGYLRRNGARYARVACSGDLRFLGRTEWLVDIEHPREEEKMLAAIVLKGDAAVSTSGDYRACWFVNGKRLHHLIDPRTGLPGGVNMQATVVAPAAAVADALATAAFFARREEAAQLFDRSPGAFGLLVAGDGRPYLIGDRSLVHSISLT